jgi:hypothetical protein
MLYGKFFVRSADYQLGSIAAPVAPARPCLPSAGKLHRSAAPAPLRAVAAACREKHGMV